MLNDSGIIIIIIIIIIITIIIIMNFHWHSCFIRNFS